MSTMPGTTEWLNPPFTSPLANGLPRRTHASIPKSTAAAKSGSRLRSRRVCQVRTATINASAPNEAGVFTVAQTIAAQPSHGLRPNAIVRPPTTMRTVVVMTWSKSRILLA